MAPLTLDPSSARYEFMKWVSERNAHIPVTELEFLICFSPLGPDDEDDWDEDNWRYGATVFFMLSE
ncbi:hypothetical protein Ga0123462_0055 [Mariprofundus ferrinatatus]|uniref:Uncharacterized protein n=1 Tax=Mariprofundus ferrinatatus TaxID=1921087 RepID=A0A2K8L7L1_9PROT|nr:hypothetical protein [Mariprofundus ferrinatatus]ATX80934.1 hypothetical protein Ga0123462_0055 [Mariprofundus ferrinatatus]